MMGRDKAARRCVVTLDEASINRGTPDQEHERAIALYDLNDENDIGVPGHDGGPYALRIALQESRLVFAMARATGEPVVTHILSLTPFRRILKDYFMVCESYYSAIRTATPSQIEAIDVGRRGLHNDGAQLLAARLEGKLEFDTDTARRIFTLVTALHWKG
jgi:uncharacterized protein (UPF0262 family)